MEEYAEDMTGHAEDYWAKAETTSREYRIVRNAAHPLLHSVPKIMSSTPNKTHK